MTAIERAEELLEKVYQTGTCTGAGTPEDACPYCQATGAQTEIDEKASELLRGYIAAVKALERRSFDHHTLSALGGTFTGGGTPRPHQSFGWFRCPDEPCSSDRFAIADFERLFPEETPAAAD